MKLYVRFFRFFLVFLSCCTRFLEHWPAQLTDVRVSVVVVELVLRGVLDPGGIRVADALALERALVELEADERKYRQNENG